MSPLCSRARASAAPSVFSPHPGPIQTCHATESWTRRAATGGVGRTNSVVHALTEKRNQRKGKLTEVNPS
jgi:hypothetical protein